MANVNEFSQPIAYQNSGNFDYWRGPYADKAAACAAIKNVIDADGKNFREGKFADIGVDGNYVTYWWKGGFENGNLVEYIDDKVESATPFTLVVNYANGASANGSILTIPAGQTGNLSYVGTNQTAFDSFFVGQVFRCTTTMVITDYINLSQPLSFALLLQKLKAGSGIVGTISPDSVMYEDSISGTTLTRKYTVIKTITADEVSNQNWFRFVFQLINNTSVASKVTITASTNLIFLKNVKIRISELETLITDAKTSAENAAAIAAGKQDSVLPFPTAFSQNITAQGGATVAGNILTIPSGQKGSLSYFGIFQPSFNSFFVGQVFKATVSVVITNYTALSQPVNLTLLLQKLKAGSGIVGEVVPESNTYTESIAGTTLNRTYSISKVITADEVSNQNFFRFQYMLINNTSVASPVTITVSTDLIYTRNISERLTDVATIANDSKEASLLAQSGLADKQNKYLDVSSPFTQGIYPAGGATASGNVITIPSGQTGYQLYFGPQQSGFGGFTVGQVFKATISIVITNYAALGSSITFQTISQKLKTGSFIGNQLESSTYTDNISGTTLTRVYTITKTITQDDIDNQYYFRFYAQRQNNVATTGVVTMTVTSDLSYSKLLIMELNDMKAQSPANVINSTLRAWIGLFNTLTRVTVKRDGSGNFTDIQAAIDSISDASIVKQYEVVIFDNWEVTSRANLKGGAVGSTSDSFIFRTKDFVHVRGNGSKKRLSVKLPNETAANDIVYSQVAFHRGFSRISNIEAVGKNIRYCIHTEGNGFEDANTFQQLTDVICNHLGNQDAVNFSSWKSDMAWGFGNSVGQIAHAKNCTFIARNQAVTYHTNKNYDFPTKLTFENCSLFQRKKDKGGDGQTRLSLNASDLGSGQCNTIELISCNFEDSVIVDGSWYTNTANRDDVYTWWWNIVGHGNKPFNLELIGLNVLKFTTANNGGAIEVTGGTAFSAIWGSSFRAKAGCSDMKAYTVGSIFIAEGGNGYVTNYMDNLGHRLGDCSTVNKTLILNINGSPLTITFDKNYSGGAVTSAPAYTTSQIMTEINTKLNGLATATRAYYEYYPELTDTFEVCRNSSATESIFAGMGVVFDRTKGVGYVRKALSGERIDGIALADIQFIQNGITADTGKIMLKDKMLIGATQFYKPYGYNQGSDITGKLLKIGSTPGAFIETSIESEAILKGIDVNVWSFI